MNLIVGSLLALVLVGCTYSNAGRPSRPASSPAPISMISSNQSQEQNFFDWEKMRFEKLGMEVSLPQTAIVREGNSNFQKEKQVYTIRITSHEDWQRDDYFYFNIVETTNIKSIRVENCKEGVEPYRTERIGMIFFDFFFVGCGYPRIAFDMDDRSYLISLPQGDWGKESERPFHVFLASIRPIQND